MGRVVFTLLVNVLEQPVCPHTCLFLVVSQHLSKDLPILFTRFPMLSIQSNELLKLDSAATKDIKCTANQLILSYLKDLVTYDPKVKSTLPPDKSSTNPKSDISSHQLMHRRDTLS